MKFQLFLDTHDEELFRKATSELGTMFFRCIDEDKSIYEIAYFSGSRIVHFTGTLGKKSLEVCVACGFEVDLIQIDEAMGMLKVIQKKG